MDKRNEEEKCPSCGKFIKKLAAICPYCGAKPADLPKEFKEDK
jgi:hypothetical protein